MILASADQVGTYTLIGGLVSLFGLAVTVLFKAGDRSEDRYRGEIDRLRVDKDKEIARLTDERDKAFEARDIWFRRYAETKGIRSEDLDSHPVLPGAGTPPSAAADTSKEST